MEIPRKQKLKSKLKYHRVVVIVLITGVIWFTYLQRKKFTTYENGQVKKSGELQNGLSEGEYIWYYPNGKRQMQGYYLKGKREGKWTMWKENGVIQNERNYVDDKLNGEFADYDRDGNKVSIGVFENDKIIHRENVKK